MVFKPGDKILVTKFTDGHPYTSARSRLCYEGPPYLAVVRSITEVGNLKTIPEKQMTNGRDFWYVSQEDATIATPFKEAMYEIR